MTQLKLTNDYSILDWILEVVSVFALISMAILIAYSFELLPPNIATHFDASGRPDAITGKGSILILPVLGIFLYILMTLAPRLTQHLNYPVRITEHNAQRQYTNMVMMLRVVKLLSMMILLYVTFAVLQNGLGKMDGLSVWFIPAMSVSLFGAIGFFIIRAFVLK